MAEEKTEALSPIIAEFESLGEEDVRKRLVSGAYGSQGYKRLMAEDWLNQKFLSRAAAAERKKQKMDIAMLIAAIIGAAMATIGAIAAIIAVTSK